MLDKEMIEANEIVSSLQGSNLDDLKRLQKIIDLLPCYIILIDSEHNILFHNKAFEQIFGKPLNKKCFSALHNREIPCPKCPPFEVFPDKTANTNAVNIMEWAPYQGKNTFRVYSYHFSADEKGATLLQVGFSTTINLQVQQALDLSEQSYRAITDNLSIGIATLTLDLRIISGNARLGSWLGPNFQHSQRICEVLQCNGRQNIPQQGSFCPDCPFQVATQDNTSQEKEFTVTFHDGKERVFRLVACPVVPKQEGGVRALIMMLEDITRRLQVNQQLQRARKLEAMTTLAGGIAHEINQPLSALHLYASGLQMLLEKQKTLSFETTHDRLQRIMHEAEKIRSIITSMRTLVMQEGQVPLEPVNLLVVLRNALSIMQNQIAAHGILLRLSIPSTLPPVRSNAVQLEQVFINLLGNAVHALDAVGQKENATSAPVMTGTPSVTMPPTASHAPFPTTATAQTPHTFSASNQSTDDNITTVFHEPAFSTVQTTDCVQAAASPVESVAPVRIISIIAQLEQETSRVLVEVADSGPGLPSNIERIFDPFFTTKEAHKGMGLGLSIVHGLVSLWGGEIRVCAHHSKLGGAAFYIFLATEK